MDSDSQTTGDPETAKAAGNPDAMTPPVRKVDSSAFAGDTEIVAAEIATPDPTSQTSTSHVDTTNGAEQGTHLGLGSDLDIIDAEPAAPPVAAEHDDVVQAERADVKRPLILRFFSMVGRTVHWLFGVVSLVAILAVLATIPILNLLSLGYLLEVCGRVARSKRLRDGFIGIDKAAIAGSWVVGTWLMILPLRFLSSLGSDAQLIDPSGNRANVIQTGLIVGTTLMIVHIVSAWNAGGKLRHFFWPINLPVSLFKRLFLGKRLTETIPPLKLFSDMVSLKLFSRARDAVWDYFESLHLRHYFMLGFQGFLGTLVILFIPTVLLIGASELPKVPAIISGVLGVPLMAITLLYLPFLQTNFAKENRLGALFEIGTVRDHFRRAPFAFLLALFITLLFALPLYLLKVELVPREVAGLPSLVFVAFIWPARILTGWAYGRAVHHEDPRFFLWRWMCRFLGLPIVAFFVLVVFLSRYISWYGAWSLFEQHAFLVPAPFLGY